MNYYIFNIENGGNDQTQSLNNIKIIACMNTDTESLAEIENSLIGVRFEDSTGTGRINLNEIVLKLGLFSDFGGSNILKAFNVVNDIGTNYGFKVLKGMTELVDLDGLDSSEYITYNTATNIYAINTISNTPANVELYTPNSIFDVNFKI